MSDYIAPATAFILPHIGGIAGAFVSRGHGKAWFEGLKRPSWQPPRSIFGPVWFCLYTSMGYSSYLVWRDGGGFGGDAAMPLAWYGSQLALNWAWSPIFFGAHSPKWAFVENLFMCGAVVGTIYNFNGVNETAARLMVPYLGWISFAAILTFKIWRDNRDNGKSK